MVRLLPKLLDRFNLKELLEQSGQDTSSFGSYLFYFGMLTLRRYRTAARTTELVVSNEVMRSLYVEQSPGWRSRSEAVH